MSVSVTPFPLFTPGNDPVPIVEEAEKSGPQGRSGQVRKISPSPGFDSRTVQPVASRYTDYAIWPVCILEVPGSNSGLGKAIARGLMIFSVS